ncbi:hypothetical protein Daura_06505 [Dactylosporangium aurantiacum]|uniref:DUF2637 domain-containing protein n=1 Tax=Dactylosporangium aurantiacum TaxID=35754 RepID=A0A9Q9IHN4_9ACTN|nr:hypothetical protein [Dactylosporangium aurantiacum]MDG6106116.1 hypothetical protein [Dactylosporangium aurantiacum]UWZ55846.1 hypothetical protein Daura_06505 [Dactylosporangium aurantiacum]
MTKTGRGWAYAGAALGGVVSVAANVAHSFVPPAGSDADWLPEFGAVVGAVFWPVAVFVAVEILARVAWPKGKRWAGLRFLGLLPVAAVAALVSYRHLSGLLNFYGEDDLTVFLGPLAVDGLMVMATGALIATGARRTTTVPAPRVGRTPIVEVDPIPQIEPTPKVQAPAPPAEPVQAVRKPAPKRQPSAAARVASAVARSPKASDATIAARLGLSEATVKRHRRQAVDSVSTPAEPSAPTLKAA